MTIIGVIWVSLSGSIDHFLYDWSRFPWVGIFSPINESPWEHLKLYFFPIMIFLIVEWFFVKNKKKLLFAKAAQIVIGMIIIISFFYTYTGALGFENVFIDIASFIGTVMIGYSLSYRIISSNYNPKLPAWFYGFFLALLFVFFQIMSYFPADLPLFQVKQTRTLGNDEGANFTVKEYHSSPTKKYINPFC